MTVLEKSNAVKEIISRHCGYGDGCPDCEFFNDMDDTDGDYFCHIRDEDGRIPFNDLWDINSAMIDGMANMTYCCTTGRECEKCRYSQKYENPPSIYTNGEVVVTESIDCTLHHCKTDFNNSCSDFRKE